MMTMPKKIYGLIGYPVKHSLSAKMHNAAFAALGINAEYRLFEIEPSKLEGFLRGGPDDRFLDTQGKEFYSKDIVGFNITIPHKVPAFFFVAGKVVRQGMDYSAMMTGAVNTVKRDGEKLVCYNTDVKGFTDSLIKDLKFNPDNKTVFVFGCGGAGRAVIAGLLPQDGFRIKNIYIYEVNQEAAASARKQFSSPIFVDKLEKIEFLSSVSDTAGKLGEVDLLVNATPIGMKEGDASMIDKRLLRKDLYVYDVVYNRTTQFIRDAIEAGCDAVGGSGMLLYQGAAAFELWTGKNAPVELMRRALEEGVSKL